MKKADLRPQLVYQNQLPSADQLGENCVLVYDRSLEKISPEFKRWVHHFPVTYAVKAGESLKSLEKFPQHVRAFSQKTKEMSARQMTLVSIGGGSVGDFAGFLASVYKRGVRLVHIPTTWLAAIDSSHGGKTALNVDGMKNQIGTFYSAERIYLVRDILLAQPSVRAQEAYSEIYKAALLAGGSFWSGFSRLGSPDSQSLWKFLKSAIDTKYKIVAKDPFEKSGYRHLLNLGHSLGHVLESLYALPHGIAVNYGIDFALEWSRHRGEINAAAYKKMSSALASQSLLSIRREDVIQKRHLAKIEQLLKGDKKRSSASKLRFIFIRGPGRCFVREVSFGEMINEIRRQSSSEV